MKRLLLSASMALVMVLAIVVFVGLIPALLWGLDNHPVGTLGVVVFGIFSYYWYDAYNSLD